MRTKSHKQNKINIVTLGCSKNLVDSEVLYSQLKANQFEVEHESKKDDSNIIIVNTCGFIENAKQESIDTILRYVDEKEAGNIDKLYVTGCLSHRYKDDLEREIPQVDAYFGTLELPNILKTLGADYKHDLIGERLITTPQHYAYLKISEGCNRPCSFCAIPLMRGQHVSKPIEQLVTEAKNLVKAGTKELMLIAQDSTYYGLDLYGERKLADLLRNLSDVEGLEWIRLHYAFPSQFPLDALDVMAERDNICKYIDIPLQHATDNMLKIMRRGITRRRTEEVIDTIRQKVPGIAIRTTLLVGHPGETEAEFNQLTDFVQQMKFDRMGVFTYSHEENTHAHSLTDDIPQEVKDERAEELMAIQQEISLEKNKEKVGNTYKVLFDRVEGGYFVGRTEFDSPEVDNEVLVDKKANYARVGDFANVTINTAEEFDLYGTIVQ
ncbi:30S ribosomal protein S12 methylthiotransferase RimO [Oscillatoria amoena NRMC-F 0135]|nr:MAG: 30S ribosomal protein S12 methylthiotransferase RimO [Bacteroidota bacterium]MDL5047024.1 30S ribosomal protein S12 methylthiotransferase RimO [Oscillatoria amoena NRMC-F 0135]